MDPQFQLVGRFYLHYNVNAMKQLCLSYFQFFTACRGYLQPIYTLCYHYVSVVCNYVYAIMCCVFSVSNLCRNYVETIFIFGHKKRSHNIAFTYAT